MFILQVTGKEATS